MNVFSQFEQKKLQSLALNQSVRNTRSLLRQGLLAPDVDDVPGEEPKIGIGGYDPRLIFTALTPGEGGIGGGGMSQADIEEEQRRQAEAARRQYEAEQERLVRERNQLRAAANAEENEIKRNKLDQAAESAETDLFQVGQDLSFVENLFNFEPFGIGNTVKKYFDMGEVIYYGRSTEGSFNDAAAQIAEIAHDIQKGNSEIRLEDASEQINNILKKFEVSLPKNSTVEWYYDTKKKAVGFWFEYKF